MRRYPSLLVLIFVVGGIVAADLSAGDSSWFLLSGLILCVSALALLPRRNSRVIGILFAAAIGLLAGFHFSIRYVHPGPRHLTQVISERKSYHIYARVADWPDLKPNRTEIKLSIDSLVSDVSQIVEGSILLKVSDTSTLLQRGDRIEFYGRVYPISDGGEPGDFRYKRYLTLKGVSGIVYLPTLLDVRMDRRSHFSPFDFVDHFRSAISRALYADLSPQSAALSSGFLIGETRDIPTAVYSMFRDSGTLHLLAVSGSNVALVLIFISFLLRPFKISRRMKAAVLLVLVLAFTMLSYGEPSVVRAPLMAALVILAGLVNRRYDLNNIIALTALIILFVDPAQLYDVGFQLSFVTAWGLIAFTPRITGLFARYHGSRWYKWLVFPLIISMVAQVCSTPLVAFHFGRVPLISPLANLIVVPLVSLAVLGTLVLLVAHAIWPLLGVFAGSLVDSLLRGVVHVLELFGGSSMPVLETGHMSSRVFEMSAALLAYVLIFFAVWSISHRWARRAALYTVAVVLNAFLLLELVSTTRPKQPEILVSSVPGGVAALVMSPGCDEADLILSGLAHQEYSLEEKIIGPLLNQRSISRIRHLILLSSAYSAIDDILRIANRYEADSVFVSRDLEPSVRDVIDDSRNARFTLPIVRFAGRPLAAQGPGLFLSDLGCAIRNKRGECVVTPRVTATHFSRSGQGHTSTLVIGSKWFPRAEDWIRLRRAGYNPIVCANIELLRPPNRDRVDLTPDLIPPGYLHDLSKQGPIRLPL